MKLSNGAKITSANYKHALMRVLNPNVGSPLASFLTDPASVNIVGALAYNNGDTQDVPGIKTLGPNTLRISLIAPNPLLPTLMALPPTGAVATNLPYSPITSVNSGNPLAAGGRYYVGVRAGSLDQDPEEPQLQGTGCAAYARPGRWVRIAASAPSRIRRCCS